MKAPLIMNKEKKCFHYPPENLTNLYIYMDHTRDRPLMMAMGSPFSFQQFPRLKGKRATMEIVWDDLPTTIYIPLPPSCPPDHIYDLVGVAKKSQKNGTAALASGLQQYSHNS
jgi:hypothetical protein